MSLLKLQSFESVWFETLDHDKNHNDKVWKRSKVFHMAEQEVRKLSQPGSVDYFPVTQNIFSIKLSRKIEASFVTSVKHLRHQII